MLTKPRAGHGAKLRQALGVATAVATMFAVFAAPLPAAADTPATDNDHIPFSSSFAGNFLAARFAGKHKHIRRAAAYYLEALRSDPGNAHLLDRAFSLSLADGQIKTAIELAKEIDTKTTSTPIARLALASNEARNKSYDAAIARTGTPSSGPLEKLTTGILAAWSKQGLGDTDGALKFLDELKGPEWFGVFKAYHAGLIASQANQFDTATTLLTSAYKTDNGAMRTAIALAIAQAHSGQMEAAVKTLSEYTERRTSHPMLERVLADLRAGKKPDLLISSPQAGVAEILYGLGLAIGQDGGGEISAIYLQLALHLDPASDLTRFALADLFERSKDYHRAISVLGSIKETSSLYRNAVIQIGLNYNALDKVDEARAKIGALVDADPSDLRAVRALGNMLRGHKLFAEAAAAYSKGIATIKDPKRPHWTFFYYRGICNERTDKWTEAEADFKKALELFPDQPHVLNYLGYSWVDKGLHLDEALAMIRKAVEQQPRDGYIVDSLGWVYYRLGRLEEAVRELERAVQLRPQDSVINDHLGDAYWRVGRKLEAKFQWSHARDLDPEPEELIKIKEKIASGLSEDATNAASITADKEPEK